MDGSFSCLGSYCSCLRRDWHHSTLGPIDRSYTPVPQSTIWRHCLHLHQLGFKDTAHTRPKTLVLLNHCSVDLLLNWLMNGFDLLEDIAQLSVMIVTAAQSITQPESKRLGFIINMQMICCLTASRVCHLQRLNSSTQLMILFGDILLRTLCMRKCHSMKRFC